MIFKRVEIRVPLIGLAGWALILARSFLLTTAAQAEIYCEFEEIYYEIKLLGAAERLSLPIDESTKSSFLFGNCRDMAILDLEDSRMTVFDLSNETNCFVQLIAKEAEDREHLYRKAVDILFWEEIWEDGRFLVLSKSGCEIRLIVIDNNIGLIKTNSLTGKAELLYGSSYATIAHFVANRTDEYRYILALFEVWLDFGGEEEGVLVAGDQGFVVVEGSQRFFVDYRDRLSVAICQHEAILARAKQLPVEITDFGRLEEQDGEVYVLRSLANYFWRSNITAISFGC